MNDLNYRVFYKAKFMLSCCDDTVDMLWEFVNAVRRWQTWKWNKDGIKTLDSSFSAWSRLKNGSRMFSLNGSERPVYIESELFSPKDDPAHLSWACTISEKKTKAPGYCERDWVTELGFRQIDFETAEFSCVISYGDTPEFIGRYEEAPEPTLPGLIGILIRNHKLKCYLGIDEIKVNAAELHVGDFPTFQKSLQNPKRIIPYIYISPRKKSEDSEETELLVNPKELAKAVCGNARVFFSKDFAFTQEMSYFFDCKEYSCYGGSIRIYKPNLDDSNRNDAYRHRSLHPSFLEEVGEKEVIRIYRRALAQNVNFYENFFDLDQCRSLKKDEQRRLRIEELQKKHQKEIGDLQDSQLEEAIIEERKRLEAEQRISELEIQLANANAKANSFNAKIQRLESIVSRVNSLEDAVTFREKIKVYPQNPKEIVDYFTTTFSDRIAFSDSAIKSLKTCRFPARDLWSILYGLSTVMWDLMQSDNSPDPYKEFYQLTGFKPARGEGPATRKDSGLMKQFTTIYNERVIDIEPHITINYGRNGQSIHFNFDSESQKIIVGHCGEHLDIYSTRKYK